MAYEGPQPLKITLKAGADLSAKQYYFVKMSADDTCVVCAAVTDIPIGVLQNKPTADQNAEICVIGETKINADAAVTAGALIGTSADGQAAPYVAGTDTTKYIVGQCILGAGAAARIGTAVVNCASPTRGA